MARNKIRFTIDVGPYTHQLFSVTENAEGALTILANRGQTSDHRLKGRQATKFDKTSIHLSKNSPGFCVTNELYYVSGDSEKTSVVVELDFGFAWLVYARMSPGHYVPNHKPLGEGKVISLGKYDPTSSTHCHVIFVTDKSRAFSTGENPERYKELCEFKKFRLIVYATHAPFPAPNSGSFFRLPSGSRRWNEEDICHRTFRTVGIPLRYIPVIRNIGVFHLRETILEYILRDFGPEIEYFSRRSTEYMKYIGPIRPEDEDQVNFDDYLKIAFPEQDAEGSGT